MELEFFDHPQPFLDAAAEVLAEQPVLGTVIAGVSERTARELLEGYDSWREVGAGFARWWLVVRDDTGVVVSAAMRTAPFPPHPTFTLPMDERAARALAGALHRRGEPLGGSNGASPAAVVIAEETARLVGARVVPGKSTRLWSASDVNVPPPPPGRLRRATEADAPLVLAWSRAFHHEADAQAGREPDLSAAEHITLDGVLTRIHEGAEWLWESPSGEVVHLTGCGLPAFGVSRIGPVFTPREHRGSGVASHVVGELTRRGLAAGHRMCLFTDLDNPVSNRIYERLGYRPVTEMVEAVVAD